MKTYVLELNGKAKVAFRAEDDVAAADWLKSDIGRLCARDYEGAITVRPATIPEQAAWREHSVGMEEEQDEQDEDESDDDLNLDSYGDLEPGSYGSGPDYFALLLDPDEYYRPGRSRRGN
jgi:hypothetical protein